MFTKNCNMTVILMNGDLLVMMQASKCKLITYETMTLATSSLCDADEDVPTG